MNVSDSTLLVLLLLATLGVIIHNNTVTVAILVLLIIRLTNMDNCFPWIEKQGLNIGIIIVTIGMLAPIASGRITTYTVLRSFVHWESLLAIAIGIVVSWLGGRGVSLMSSQPSVIAGLLMGTVLGVALFHGVPVGPFIAAGLLSLLIDNNLNF
ncbi:DUF441 domain-containing protein [Candidatus Hoaglandella endobia]|uniref:UPF0756 membrane protein TPER_HE00204 n=1 Tax=Candidatus Hoaglandella endobia TaxID=1778263 RepID=A0A143WTS9_9ENTR|nr:DUF441 domain-containing protein [Candidatus Hoaglandella endobia]CUX97137.1 hypothetical protein TPER_HE00204 [Candidatus Hoaglandella endobia]